MQTKFINFYFLFFSLSLSAAIFPSMLGNYSGYLVSLGVGIFVLDELILLTSLFLMMVYFLRKQVISKTIDGYGMLLLSFLIWITAVFISSFFREANSVEIISRDRWILLNSLVLLMPFIYMPSIKELRDILRNFFFWLLLLITLKFCSLIFFGSESNLSQFGPSFLFIISLSLAMFIMSSENLLQKLIGSFVVLIASILGQQLSAILLTFLCIIVPFSYQKFRFNKQNIIFIFAFSIISIYFFSTFIIENFILYFGLNPLNFSILNKLINYIDLWTVPFENLTFLEFLIGRGAGFSYQFESFNELIRGYTFADHSLAHNFLITIFMKFGLVGLSLFVIILFLVFQPLSKKFNFKESALLKLILILILINFFSTPGIWKIRKGVFLWFTLGLIYFYRKHRESRGSERIFND